MRTSALPPVAISATLPPFPDSQFPFPKLIVGDTSGAIGYNTGVKNTGKIACAGVAALIAAMAPLAAEANAGTPLILSGALHLLFGNFVIGVAEGSLLCYIYPRRASRAAVAFMVVANYLSAWLGYYLLNAATPVFYWAGLRHLKAALCCAVVVAYLLTVVVEAPFVWLSIRRGGTSLGQVAKASFIVQGASYAAMLLWYSLVSSTSICSAEVVDASAMDLPGGFIVKYQDCGGRWLAGDLRTCEWSEAPAPDRAEEKGEREPLFLQLAVRTVGETNDVWKCELGFWAAEGLKCRNTKTRRLVRFAFETPFAMWSAREATQLPDGKVVFRLGRDQICVADPDKNRIALLARGTHVSVEAAERPEGKGDPSSEAR